MAADVAIVVAVLAAPVSTTVITVFTIPVGVNVVAKIMGLVPLQSVVNPLTGVVAAPVFKSV